jgi:hypothetical protein
MFGETRIRNVYQLRGSCVDYQKVFPWEATTPSAHQCKTVPEGSLK